MKDLGNKVMARTIAQRAGIPSIPGTGNLPRGEAGITEAFAFATRVGYPVMIKASSGGGGRGIRKVVDEPDLLTQLPLARAEARSAFNDDGIYLEKCIESPRHVEIQILADEHGNIVHLGSRDCSIQRRHQKLLEIAPADLPENVLSAMYDAAIAAARESGYVNAGTVEFLVDARTNEFWFMEINTRLQVEHTVTEERYRDRRSFGSRSGSPKGGRCISPGNGFICMGKRFRYGSMRKIRRTTSCRKGESGSKCTNPLAVRE